MSAGAIAIIVELLAVIVVQLWWMRVYYKAFGKSSPLASVWLSKAGVLALVWVLLLINEIWFIPLFIWWGGIAPALIMVNVWWLEATYRVARHFKEDAEQEKIEAQLVTEEE